MTSLLDQDHHPELPAWAREQESLVRDAELLLSRDNFLARLESIDPTGAPAISYMDLDKGVRYARWNGRRWRAEVVDDRRFETGINSLVFDGNGDPLIAYDLRCSTSLELARRQQVSSVLYRGVVTDLTGGWKGASLPLDAGNDDETAPFPIETLVGQFADDTLASPESLTLYRLLIDGTRPAGNVLRMVGSPGALEIHY